MTQTFNWRKLSSCWSIYINTYRYVLCLSCFGTIHFILAHPDQQRSQIRYCSTKEAETGKCVKIPLACSKGAILHLKSEWPVLRGVPLHGKRKCLSNCIKVPISPCMWTHTQPQGGEAINLLLANAKPFGDDPIHVKLPYQYGHSFMGTVTSLPHQRFRKKKKTYGLDKAQI